MGSLLPDFENDIFISYRQNDNKYDGWVTDFVNNLNRELEATFKQKITVYFDANPHDGLLETHSVSLSLNEKLRSIIFIPVLSRTYCDEKSFAWNNEFIQFLDIAAHDRYGLNIRLSGGNYASRVLPVRIHDLSGEDKSLVEKHLGSIRAVDFIYRSAGVNRPLRACEDHPHDNLNKTYYRDQINKTANAIAEIFRSITISRADSDQVAPKAGENIFRTGNIAVERKVEHRKLHGLPAALFLTFFVLFTFVVIFAPGLFRKKNFSIKNTADDRLSVAIFPFWNMTADTSWNIWQEAVQSDLAATLSGNSGDLYIRQVESINRFLGRYRFSEYNSFTAAAAKVSGRMETDIYIYGTLKKSGDVIRINAQLIKAEKSEPYKSFQVEGAPGSILHLTDSLSSLIRETLMITRFENKVPEGYRHLISTTSPDAMRYFTHGHNAFMRKDCSTALRYLSQSVSSDSGFALSLIMLDLTYIGMGDYTGSKSLSSRILSRINNMSTQNRMLSQWLFSVNNETPYEELKYLRLLQETTPALPLLRLAIGHSYLKVMQYGDAAGELEKALEEQEKMDPGLILPQHYTMLGTALHMTGQYGKEEKIYVAAGRAFPADADLRYNQAVLALAKKDTAAAREYIKKYRACLSAGTWPEQKILTGIAHIYSDAGYRENAESSFRMALSSSNGDPEAINELASFLVANGKTAEGLDLIEPLLKKDSLNFNYLYTRGKGLFRQSEYVEAFRTLNLSWNLRCKYSVYDHEAFLCLDSVKKKAEGLKTVF